MYNILICDDEKDIVNALKIYLNDTNYHFLEAFDGEEAVNMVREKLEINPAEPRYLKVVWGQGYKCEKQG